MRGLGKVDSSEACVSRVLRTCPSPCKCSHRGTGAAVRKGLSAAHRGSQGSPGT